jgi:hypothetical protein
MFYVNKYYELRWYTIILTTLRHHLWHKIVKDNVIRVI